MLVWCVWGSSSVTFEYWHGLKGLVQSNLCCLNYGYIYSTFEFYFFQIDIPTDIQQKSIRAAQRYLSGKDVNPAIFDEAQYQVFKELLPYWAGFVKNFKPPEDEKKPSKNKDKKPLCKLTPFLSAVYKSEILRYC